MNQSNSSVLNICGIDVGTSTMEVSIWKDGRIENVSFDQSQFTYPSCLFVDSEVSVSGFAALVKGYRKPQGLITHSKRLIGLKYKNPIVERDKNTWTCSIVDQEGMASFYVKYDDTRRGIDGRVFKVSVDKEFTPIDVTATILKDIHERINNFTDRVITNAVISVPATFNNDQRAATVSAAKIAGFDGITICTEPTAAAIAFADYSMVGMNSERLSGLVMVYDLGGGTFDVSIMRVEGNHYTILANHGDSHLGGEDFDRILFDYCQKCGRDNNKPELSNNNKAKLMSECHEKKHSFTCDNFVTTIHYPCSHDNEPLEIQLTSAIVKHLFEPLINKTIVSMKICMQEAKVNVSLLSKVILIGGSSRLSVVSEILKENFDINLSRAINPDLAVSIGALLIGMSRIPEVVKDNKRFCVTDCTSFNIYLQDRITTGSIIVKKNTPLPAHLEKLLQLKEVGRRLKFVVYQGSDCVLANDELLGQFYIDGIVELFRKHPFLNFKLFVDIDEGGIITLSCKCIEEPDITKETKMELYSRVMDDDSINLMREHQNDRRIMKEKKNLKDNALYYIERLLLRIKDSEIKESLQLTVSYLEDPARSIDDILETIKSLKQMDEENDTY